MVCKNCGNYIDDNSMVCRWCGADLRFTQPYQGQQGYAPPSNQQQNYAQGYGCPVVPVRIGWIVAALVLSVLTQCVPSIILTVIALIKASNVNANEKAGIFFNSGKDRRLVKQLTVAAWIVLAVTVVGLIVYLLAMLFIYGLCFSDVVSNFFMGGEDSVWLLIKETAMV